MNPVDSGLAARRKAADVDLVNHPEALERLVIVGQVRCEPLALQTDPRGNVSRFQLEPTNFWVTRMVAVCSSRVRGRPSSPVPRGREGSDTLLLPDHEAAPFVLELPDPVRIRAM